MRRLRALGEPTTLFAETDEERFDRMLLAELNVQVWGRWGQRPGRGGGGASVCCWQQQARFVAWEPAAPPCPVPTPCPSRSHQPCCQVEDEARGGGELDNLHVQFRREAKEAAQAKRAGGDRGKKGKEKDSKAGGGGKEGGGGAADKGAGGAGGDPQQQAEGGGGEETALAELDPEQQVGAVVFVCGWVGWRGCGGGGVASARLAPPSVPLLCCYPTAPPHTAFLSKQRLMEAFQAAAEAIKEKSMPVEERIAKWLRRWMKVGGVGRMTCPHRVLQGLDACWTWRRASAYAARIPVFFSLHFSPTPQLCSVCRLGGGPGGPPLALYCSFL